jgi:copper(I)-binding protein
MLLAAFILPGIGCSPGPPVITIEEQEAKLSPVIIGSGSVYMKIVNSGGGGDSLVKAQINIPDAIIELHDFQEGKMATVDRIPIPAKTTVQLRPASYHIMIFRMPKQIQEGSEVIVTLSFEKHAELKVPLQFTPNATNRKRGRY